MTSSDIWQAKLYTQFLQERTRPARDLLAAIPETFHPGSVYDLGCGPGNSTILLKDRWPNATIIGLDSSKDMLAEAKKDYPHITFMESDLTQFSPEKKPDCIFSNATLQWVDHHDTLIPKLLQQLSAGGIFAMQIPNNWHCPSHQISITILERHAQWKSLLKNFRYGHLQTPFYDPAFYYDIFAKAHAQSIQIWQTEYWQELSDHEAIFKWVEGTALRPLLAHMHAQDQADFKAAYVQAIKEAYPLRSNGKVLLPYLRLFVVASV